ncbi:MAG TPA: GNAT family N-acetyltransferase [Acidimicrobiia bacterium]|nr:GNAT family N-acetyltransferase [Acidimicrobiia bacterium]
MERCRPAERGDLPRVAALARELRDELVPMRGGALLAARDARPEPLEATFAALLTHPDIRVVVGLIDDVIVGFGVLEVEVLSTNELLGRITELFVEPEARSVSVGEAMTEALLAFATERRCVGVDTLALPGHRATKNFFEEQGFVARLLVMHHPIRDDDR